MGSVAARPAATPLVVPISPPKTIADWGLSNPMYFATKGVPIITKIDLTKPAATLNVITVSEAPIASPVTGPTIYVTAPEPIVVMAAASV